MAEEAHFLVVPREHLLCYGLAANYFFFPILERDPIERRVIERVVAEVQAGLEPLIERGDAGVHFSGVGIEAAFVDEAHAGSFLLFYAPGAPVVGFSYVLVCDRM